MIDEVYITMCREAVEIHEEWEPKEGNRLINNGNAPHHSFVFVILKENIAWNGKYPHQERFSWLPWQEDLQKIYAENHSFTTWGIIEKFYKFFKSKCAVCNVSNRLNANENLNVVWLCFIMETVYGKRWNGETWEVIR